MAISAANLTTNVSVANVAIAAISKNLSESDSFGSRSILETPFEADSGMKRLVRLASNVPAQGATEASVSKWAPTPHFAFAQITVARRPSEPSIRFGIVLQDGDEVDHVMFSIVSVSERHSFFYCHWKMRKSRSMINGFLFALTCCTGRASFQNITSSPITSSIRGLELLTGGSIHLKARTLSAFLSIPQLLFTACSMSKL